MAAFADCRTSIYAGVGSRAAPGELAERAGPAEREGFVEQVRLCVVQTFALNPDISDDVD